MLVTAGFSDILDMGFERRYDLFDLRVKYPPPLVPRRLRLRGGGARALRRHVETPLDETAAKAARRALPRARYRRGRRLLPARLCQPSARGRAPRQILREFAPDLFVSTSADVFPNMREFERWTTTTRQRLHATDVRSLSRAPGEWASPRRASAGGSTSWPPAAARSPPRRRGASRCALLESGPAAGVLMCAYHGRSLDLPNLLSFDMGGTTAKGALMRGGSAASSATAWKSRACTSSGRAAACRCRIPVIDMIEIGAGGGSIADIDERGLLRVGPRSAGADPGPACYGRGGTRPTLTDANLVLGYLDAGFFLGGAMALDRTAARERHPRRGGQAARPRSAARRLGHPRHRQRGRGARLPHPRQRARLRLPLAQHGGVRRLRAAARAAHRAQAQDPARGVPRRRRRHVGVRPADQPAGASRSRARGASTSPTSTRADFAATFAALETEATSYLAERRRRQAATSA